MMVEATKDLDEEVKGVTVSDYTEKMKVVYPKTEEELIDILNRCKLKGSEVMLCSCCSVVFDKDSPKDLKNVRPN